MTIILLLDDPNPDSPYNGNAAALFKSCSKIFNAGKKNADNFIQFKSDCFKPYNDLAKSSYKSIACKPFMKYFEQDDAQEQNNKSKQEPDMILPTVDEQKSIDDV